MITTCSGETIGGITSPRSSPCTITITPMVHSRPLGAVLSLWKRCWGGQDLFDVRAGGGRVDPRPTVVRRRHLRLMLPTWGLTSLWQGGWTDPGRYQRTLPKGKFFFRNSPGTRKKNPQLFNFQREALGQSWTSCSHQTKACSASSSPKSSGMHIRGLLHCGKTQQEEGMRNAECTKRIYKNINLITNQKKIKTNLQVMHIAV